MASGHKDLRQLSPVAGLCCTYKLIKQVKSAEVVVKVELEPEVQDTPWKLEWI